MTMSSGPCCTASSGTVEIPNVDTRQPAKRKPAKKSKPDAEVARSRSLYWQREYGDWSQFKVTPELIALTDQVIEDWQKLKDKLLELHRRETQGRAAVTGIRSLPLGAGLS
jgi:hypothetical protein